MPPWLAVEILVKMPPWQLRFCFKERLRQSGLSAGLGLPMASPPQHSSFPILLILFPLALSQFRTSSYSYSPYYSTQTPASPYFPTSRFTSFTPYTSYPSVSYLRPGFRNQNSKNVFSGYRSLGNQMQRNQKMYPTFPTQRSYSQAYIKPKSSRNMIRAQVKNFYPDQISPSLTPALPKPEVTPAWQVIIINELQLAYILTRERWTVGQLPSVMMEKFSHSGLAVTRSSYSVIIILWFGCQKYFPILEQRSQIQVVDCKTGEDEKDCEWHKR